MTTPKYKLGDIVKFEVDRNLVPTHIGFGSMSVEAEVVSIRNASSDDYVEYCVCTDDHRVAGGNGAWGEFIAEYAHDLPLYKSIADYTVYPTEQDYVRFIGKKFCNLTQKVIISAVQLDLFNQPKSAGANCEKCNEYIPYASVGITCYRCRNEKKLFGYE